LPGAGFLNFGPLRLGPLRLLDRLRAARLGRVFGNVPDMEIDHGRAPVLDAALRPRAQSEQHEQHQRFDQQGQANAKRAASGGGADPLGERNGWNGPRLKQWVFDGGVRGGHRPGATGAGG
jgi:hypothetical protein